ncbi:MAG: GNAT family N-acetyltransferase [Pseudomonadota bacterium]
MTPPIHTERLTLRPWREGDLPSLDAILGDPDVMEFSEAGPLSVPQQAAWLAGPRAGMACYGLPGTLAIELRGQGTVIGYVSLTRDLERVASNEAEIGFRLATSHWGFGYASEAAKAVIEADTGTCGTDRIVAIVDPHNLRSLHVLEKLGMTYARDIMFDGYDYPDHLLTLPVPP